MLSIRPETPADSDAIRQVNQRAFGRDNEANLVDALRNAGALSLSLVAERDGTVVSHIAFSPVTLKSTSPGRSAAIVALAPMAVLPEQQRQGVGGQLVEAGLEACRQAGVQAVVVLGHPEYYPRFGFQPAGTFGLQCEFPVPPEAYLVILLQPDALAGRLGVIHYHPAFHQV